MVWLLSIGGGLVGLFLLVMAWGLLHSRHSKLKALAAIRQIEISEIESLTRECVEVFEQKLGVRLNLDDCDDTARKLDDAFRDKFKLKGAFERDDLYWHFVKPVGSCLGELLRQHCRHDWRKNPNDAPFMQITLKNGDSQVFPYEKVIKHLNWGEPGDLVAYITFARTIDQVAEQMKSD